MCYFEIFSVRLLLDPKFTEKTRRMNQIFASLLKIKRNGEAMI